MLSYGLHEDNRSSVSSLGSEESSPAALRTTTLSNLALVVLAGWLLFGQPLSPDFNIYVKVFVLLKILLSGLREDAYLKIN